MPPAGAVRKPPLGQPLPDAAAVRQQLVRHDRKRVREDILSAAADCVRFSQPPLRLMQQGEIAQAKTHRRMRSAKRVLPQSQSAAVQCLGFIQPPLLFAEFRQIAPAHCRSRVILTQRGRPDRQGLQIELFRLVQPALRLQPPGLLA